MSDGQQTRTSLVLSAGVTITIALLVLTTMLQAFPKVDQQFDEARAYCDQQFGEDNYELTVSHVVGDHGGLHCKAENGTLIHIHDVPKDELKDAKKGQND